LVQVQTVLALGQGTYCKPLPRPSKPSPLTTPPHGSVPADTGIQLMWLCSRTGSFLSHQNLKKYSGTYPFSAAIHSASRGINPSCAVAFPRHSNQNKRPSSALVHPQMPRAHPSRTLQRGRASQPSPRGLFLVPGP
jgi:hypothetical protein